MTGWFTDEAAADDRLRSNYARRVEYLNACMTTVIALLMVLLLLLCAGLGPEDRPTTTADGPFSNTTHPATNSSDSGRRRLEFYDPVAALRSGQPSLPAARGSSSSSTSAHSGDHRRPPAAGDWKPRLDPSAPLPSPPSPSNSSTNSSNNSTTSSHEQRPAKPDDDHSSLLLWHCLLLSAASAVIGHMVWTKVVYVLAQQATLVPLEGSDEEGGDSAAKKAHWQFALRQWIAGYDLYWGLVVVALLPLPFSTLQSAISPAAASEATIYTWARLLRALSSLVGFASIVLCVWLLVIKDTIVHAFFAANANATEAVTAWLQRSPEGFFGVHQNLALSKLLVHGVLSALLLFLWAPSLVPGDFRSRIVASCIMMSVSGAIAFDIVHATRNVVISTPQTASNAVDTTLAAERLRRFCWVWAREVQCNRWHTVGHTLYNLVWIWLQCFFGRSAPDWAPLIDASVFCLLGCVLVFRLYNSGLVKGSAVPLFSP